MMNGYKFSENTEIWQSNCLCNVKQHGGCVKEENKPGFDPATPHV
jgi:hypothetical protein